MGTPTTGQVARWAEQLRGTLAMTEQEWLASGDPLAMLAWLTPSAAPSSDRPRAHERHPSDRKLRLLACACCRAAEPLSPVSLQAVRAAEAVAEEPTAENRHALDRATWHRDDVRDGGRLPTWVYVLHFLNPGECADAVLHNLRVEGKRDLSPLASVVREIVGNPFRPVTFPPCPTEMVCERCGTLDASHKRPFVKPYTDLVVCGECESVVFTRHLPHPWITPLVVSLARAAYAERDEATGQLDPAPLMVLADALEEAGCTGPLLEHLRTAGPHYCGCFALDAVLGRG